MWNIVHIGDLRKSRQRKEVNEFSKSLSVGDYSLNELFSLFSLDSDEKENEEKKEEIMITDDFKLIKKSFRNFVWKTLEKDTQMNSSVFLWALYMENLLDKIFHLPDEVFDKFYIIDYMNMFNNSNNPEFLKKWWDMAMLRSSIFIGKYRNMTKDDYVQMWRSMFYTYFAHTWKDIWYIMSSNFIFWNDILKSFLDSENISLFNS